METIVLLLYGVWFWITREPRMEAYNQAAATLQSARVHLQPTEAHEEATCEAARELLDAHARSTALTAASFPSLTACVRFVAEELRQQQRLELYQQQCLAETQASVADRPTTTRSVAAGPVVAGVRRLSARTASGLRLRMGHTVLVVPRSIALASRVEPVEELRQDEVDVAA